jgi:hypothetical protein
MLTGQAGLAQISGPYEVRIPPGYGKIVAIIAPRDGKSREEIQMQGRALRQKVITIVATLGLIAAAAQTANADDRELATKIAQALRAGGMKQFNVGVGCKGGVVTLGGQVASEAQRQLALTIAKNTESVTQVVDKLSLNASQVESAPRTQMNLVIPGPPTLPTPMSLPTPVSHDREPSKRMGFPALVAHCAAIAVERYLLNSHVALDVELGDGSRIVARAIEPSSFRLTSRLGTLTVPLALVGAVERKSDGNVRVRLTNGDTMTGKIEFAAETKVRLIAACGEMTVSADAIVKINRREPPKVARN